jgi:hypothetical protein
MVMATAIHQLVSGPATPAGEALIVPVKHVLPTATDAELVTAMELVHVIQDGGISTVYVKHVLLIVMGVDHATARALALVMQDSGVRAASVLQRIVMAEELIIAMVAVPVMLDSGDLIAHASERIAKMAVQITVMDLALVNLGFGGLIALVSLKIATMEQQIVMELANVIAVGLVIHVNVKPALVIVTEKELVTAMERVHATRDFGVKIVSASIVREIQCVMVILAIVVSN